MSNRSKPLLLSTLVKTVPTGPQLNRLHLIRSLDRNEPNVLDGRYKIYGSPWQPEFCDWAFNLPRGEPLAQASLPHVSTYVQGLISLSCA